MDELIKYVKHVVLSIINKQYRKLCVKHELEQQYWGETYHWMNVAKSWRAL